jgi:4-hydroxybenzoate polyprenyltransferase
VFVDVLTESVNNPLRMLLGWYIVTSAVPPASLLISYWMIGCYFMALKRFSEFRQINDRAVAGAYRRSFQSYNERNLLVSITFYAASAMLFFGAFAMRYRFELIFAFPAVATVMAIYFNLAFEKDGAVQNPEKLYRQPTLMIGVTACVAIMVLLLNVRLPWVVRFFDSHLP